MDQKISIVINTLNDEKNLQRVIKSVEWANEILVCDMESEDKTVEIAKRLGAKVATHRRLNFVEPARNFAISKTSNEWILILDPDEEVGKELMEKVVEISSKMKQINYVKIPRKNIIFGKWIKSAGWWPDYNIRFFRKGTVEWTNKIHRPPHSDGEGIELEAKEELAIVHRNYESLDQFLEKMTRYTKAQAEDLIKEGYKLKWQDLIKKPLGEFLNRFFAQKGFQDGLHGLILSLLQSLSFLIVYLRVWEKEKYLEKNINLWELEQLNTESAKQISYWFKYGNLSKNLFKRFFQKVKSKI